jgi:L,D-peptidoglycan transpeptidase YkuD (ErfK/YbiS/YcfS/YnhG family)
VTSRIIRAVAAGLALAAAVGCAGGGSPHTSRQHPRERGVAEKVFRRLPAGTRQAIVVAGPSLTATTAELTAYERRDDGWHPVHGPAPVRIGRNGFTRQPREGAAATPAGVFALPLAFGWDDPGTRLPWRTATADSWWVDDPTSPLYDTWQTGPAAGRWKSAERLRITPYRLAISIATNPDRVPYGGSAIFLHLPINDATEGCVTVDEDTLRWLLGWLDPAARPRAVMGPEADLNG